MSRTATLGAAGMLSLSGLLAPGFVAHASANPSEVPESSITAIWENDGGWTNPITPTDENYTAAAVVAIQWNSPAVNRLADNLPTIFSEFDASRDRVDSSMGLVGGLQMYTPEDITINAPLFDQHPYAGLGFIGLILQRANRTGKVAVMEHWEVDVATVGPGSQAGKVQTWLHSRFDSEDRPEGWEYQIKDDLGIDLKYLRQWRMVLKQWEGRDLRLEMVPEAAVRIGTQHVDAAGGAMFRLGWRMPDDFGPTRPEYISDFTRPGGSDRLSGYIFIRPRVRLVAHDVAIDGSLFRDSPVEADSEPVVGELQGGVVIQFLRHFELMFASTLLSEQFEEQDGWHDYATISLRGAFAW